MTKVQIHNLEQCKKYLDEGKIIDAIECSANNNKITYSERGLGRLLQLLLTLGKTVSNSIYVVNIKDENKNSIKYYLSKLRKYGIQVLIAQNNLYMTQNSELGVYCKILDIHNCGLTYDRYLKTTQSDIIENLLKNLYEQKEKENAVSRA